MSSPAIFLAAPRPAQAPIAPPSFTGLAGIRWEAWDGTTWDLLNPAGGTFLGNGVRGLTLPPATRHVTESPAVAGTDDADDDHVGEREVFWPLWVYSNAGSQAWLERDRAFWRTLRRRRYGWWVVTHPDGTERRLRCKVVDDGQHSYAVDPLRRGWALYGITLVAPDPYWQGAPIVRSWKAADPVEFFQADGLHIAPGSNVGNARIDNPGDEDAWPVWRVTGPSTSVSVGVDGQVVEVPFALGDGERVVIDTHPRAQTAIDNAGVDRTPELGAIDYAPVAPGASVQLDVSLVGTGHVEASLTPLYERAW